MGPRPSMRTRASATRVHALALTAAALAACATAPPRGASQILEREFCARPRVATEPPGPGAIPLDPVTRAALTRRFSPVALDLAEIIGAAEALSEFARLERAGDAAALARARAQVERRVRAAELAVHSVVSELDCDHERTQVVVRLMRSRASTRTTQYAVASIVVGAAAAVATSVLVPFNGTNGAQAVIGVTGGAAAGALGITAALVTAQVTFRPAHSPLAEVWLGPERSSMYPAVVWRYLSDPRFSADGRRSRRVNLVQAWIDLGRLGDGPTPDPRLVDLYFGRGGSADADELDALAAMEGEVRAAVELMEQDLLELAREMDRDESGTVSTN